MQIRHSACNYPQLTNISIIENAVLNLFHTINVLSMRLFCFFFPSCRIISKWIFAQSPLVVLCFSYNRNTAVTATFVDSVRAAQLLGNASIPVHAIFCFHIAGAYTNPRNRREKTKTTTTKLNNISATYNAPLDASTHIHHIGR